MKVASCILLIALAISFTAKAQTPAPTLVAPASGASLVQPITLDWNEVVDPNARVGSYTWQVATTSGFTTIIAQGSQNLADESIPLPTQDVVSGLPNGVYFWRVKAFASAESAWSAVRSFTVTGLGPAPGTPSFTSPASGSAFHPLEFFDITWTAVPGALYYLLEADDQSSFSHPLTLTTEAMQFGTRFHIGWGNEIPNIFYRVRAVSADNVRGLPSATLNVRIVNTAPVPPAPTLLSPVGGASITLPFVFDWTDTPNPQIPGYDLDIDNEPNFDGAVGVLLAQGISRSDYMVVEDPLLEGSNNFPPGTYFWRVRALHGNVAGPWSATGTFTISPSPASPPGIELFWLINEPGSVSGGNPTQARVTLNQPAGPGGALVKIASDMPHAETPPSVLIPEGKTDGWVSPVSTIPVSGATIGNIRAAYAGKWQQSSLGLWQILFGLSLSDESVVGGDTVVGAVTLLNPAPPGGVEITIVSSDTSLAAPPATVVIPAGESEATFAIPTASVSVPTRVVINCGSAAEGYRAPENWLNLLPAGSPAPAPSLASLSLANRTVTGGGGTTTATVTLTGPAPAGGASVWVNGSMEGQVVTPGNVIVPAGSTSANFTITAPQVNARHYVLIQARYGTFGGSQAKLLEIDPAPAGAPTVLALDVRPRAVIGGGSTRGMVGLAMPAPAGGGVVSLSASDPSLAQVPSTVFIAAGNSANSFDITTSRVFAQSSVRIDATAGGITKSFWIDLAADPNAPPLLQSVALNPTSVAGGGSSIGTVFLSQPAPAGGISVTLVTSSSIAKAPGVVTVPGGQTSASFTVTTSPVSSSTQVTVSALYDTTRSATLTVTSGSSTSTPSAPTLVSPANDATVAQPITFDWNNVANAASYEIQIDNSSTISAPFVANQTVTASQTTISGLPAQRLWWRVRARNSAGVFGPFSSVRRFTPQAAPAAPGLSSLTLSPASVTGGNNSQGTVTLTSAAPSDGLVIALASNNSNAVVPPSVTIPAGATSASFAITTHTVTSAISATITATYNGVTRSATLTINPVSSTPLSAPSLIAPSNDARFDPGQNITFDWADVSGAASYTIQIDDKDSFPSPWLVNQTVTASTFSTSTLPVRTMWWRVRANNSAGAAGNWSAIRRVEVKD